MSNWYKFGYHTCEDSGYSDYSHEELFDEVQLNKILGQAMKMAALQIKNTEDGSRKLDKVGYTAEDMFMTQEFHAALRELGFTSLCAEHTVSIKGWSCIINPRNPDWERDDREDSWDIEDDQKEIHRAARMGFKCPEGYLLVEDE